MYQTFLANHFKLLTLKQSILNNKINNVNR